MNLCPLMSLHASTKVLFGVVGHSQGNVVTIQAWALRRMISVYNSVTRRPHVPRERALRRILISQGFDIELDSPPKAGPCVGSSHGGGDPNANSDSDQEEGCESEASFTDDEEITVHVDEKIDMSPSSY